MTTHAQPTGIQSVEIHLGRDTSLLRVPRMESEADYFLMEEQLLSQVCRRPATNWTVDLSDHTDGITLVLAGVLAGFCEEARRSGCTVKYVGLREPSAKCEGRLDVAFAPARCASRRGWIGVTEAPSYLPG